jgi:hypothetical protein
MPAGSGGRRSSRFTAPQRRLATRRTSSSRTIRNPPQGKSRTCRTRRSYHPRLDPSATIANRFFERRSRRTMRAFGSPNTPPTVARARKPANEYPSDRRHCRFPDSAIAQRAKIERTPKLKKTSIHKLFRRHDAQNSPGRLPEDPKKSPISSSITLPADAEARSYLQRQVR